MPQTVTHVTLSAGKKKEPRTMPGFPFLLSGRKGLRKSDYGRQAAGNHFGVPPRMLPPAQFQSTEPGLEVSGVRVSVAALIAWLARCGAVFE